MTMVPGVGTAAAPGRAVPKELLLLFAPGTAPGGATSWPCNGDGPAWAKASLTVPTAPSAKALASSNFRIFILRCAPSGAGGPWQAWPRQTWTAWGVDLPRVLAWFFVSRN